MKATIFVAAAAALAFASPANAQAGPQSMVSIYHVAPGHHVAFLKWLARQDQINAAAGLPASQLYAHMDGDSWDYVVIAPSTNAQQDAAFDAAARKMGINPMRGGIEMRTHVNSHTDTMTAGPITAAQYLAQIGER